MAAPKGNQFWKLRSSHGREKLFTSPELMWEAACEYFEWCTNPTNLSKEQIIQGGKRFNVPKMKPFTLIGLCHYLDCDTSYFSKFIDELNKKKSNASLDGSIVEFKETDEDFFKVVTRIREVILRQQLEGAMEGFFKENIVARINGLADKTKAEAAPAVIHHTVDLKPEEVREFDKALEEEY